MCSLLSFIQGCSWQELPDDAKHAAEKLGYCSAVWNAVGEPKKTLLGAHGEFQKEWKDLDEDLAKAAGVLGFTEETWDNK